MKPEWNDKIIDELGSTQLNLKNWKDFADDSDENLDIWQRVVKVNKYMVDVGIKKTV